MRAIDEHFVASTTVSPRILVIEDDPAVAELVQLYLRNAGFELAQAATARAARIALADFRPELIVLDLGLPDTDGTDLLREIRERSAVPVLALTARAEDAQKVEALEAGLDDYVTKPFNPRELVARVRAILRRTATVPADGPLVCGDLALDPARREVSVAGRPVRLRAKEFELLAYLLGHVGLALTREALLEDVWGYAVPGETRTIDVHVKQLREKLAGSTARIETIWGVGYKLAPP